MPQSRLSQLLPTRIPEPFIWGCIFLLVGSLIIELITYVPSSGCGPPMESEYEYEMRTRAGRVASELSRPRLGTYRELQCETRDSEPTSDDDDEQYTPRAIASGRQAPARPQFLPDARHRRAPSPLPTCREHVRPRKECDKCFADLEEYYRFTRMERFRQARAQTEALADLYDSPQRPPPPHRFAPVLRANPQVPAS